MSKAKQEALQNKRGTTMITIFRHGETKMNKQGLVRGWSNPPIDDEAKPKIEATARDLKGDVDVIVSSDLLRTKQTAKIVSDIVGVPVSDYDIAFRPWDVGDYTGEPATEVHRIIWDLARNQPDKKVPGGESFNDFKKRCLDGFTKYAKKYKNKRIVIVAHHRNDKIWAAWRKKGFNPEYDVDVDIFVERDGVEPGCATRPTEFP